MAAAAATVQADARLVLLIESAHDSYKTVHFALGTTRSAQITYLARGFDWGLPQASDFVATAALELLRRWLEAIGPDSALEDSSQAQRST